MALSIGKYLLYSCLGVTAIFVLSSNSLVAQSELDSLQILDAVILTSDSLLPVHNAHVISKFNRWGTITNKEGRFKIYVKDNDSVLITSIGLSSLIVEMKPHHFIEDSIVVFHMPKDTVSINEVVIRAYWDYTTMKQIVIDMHPIDLSQFYPDWNGTGLLYREPTPMSFKGPIQALYDVFNRSARLQRKLMQNRKDYNRNMNQMGRYGDTIPVMPEHRQGLPD